MPPKGLPSRSTTLHFCRIALFCSASSLFCRLFSHCKALTHVLQGFTAQNPRLSGLESWSHAHNTRYSCFSDPRTLKYRESAAIYAGSYPTSRLSLRFTISSSAKEHRPLLLKHWHLSVRDADNPLVTTLSTSPSPTNGLFVRGPTRSADPAT